MDGLEIDAATGEDDILVEARERFDDAYTAESENRVDMVDDLHFRKGNQWPDKIKRDREDDNRPCLTINRIAQFVRQVVGDMRQNSPSIKVLPVDSASDPETADTLSDLIRQIEYSSNAKSAYSTAADFQVACGYGVIKVGTEYTHDDVFEQDIVIERVANPFTIYFDPSAVKKNKEDGNFAFETTMMDRKVFNKKYPNSAPGDFNSLGTGVSYEHWFTEKTVRLAKYWRKVPVKKLLVLMSDGRTVADPTEQDLLELEAKGITVERDREADSFKIERYLITGNEVLEGPDDWAGKFIPLIPVYGEEHNIEGYTIYKGIVRDAKDPQRMFNYWRTTGVETVALQPKVPWVLTKEQIKGHERRFKRANIDNLPYLTYNPDGKAPPPRREPPPQVSSGILAETSQAADDMKATTGIYDAALGAQSNEKSGRAILARQNATDQGNYVYTDNMADAIGIVGKIIIDLIPSIYDSERVIRVRGEDGGQREVTINKQVRDGVNNVVEQDLTRGKYDVVVSVGPSYSTRRLESADSMLQFMQAVPGSAAVIADLVAESMDWPGASAVADRLKKMMPPGVVDSDDDEEKAAAQKAAEEQAAKEEEIRLLGMKEQGANIADKEASAAKKNAEAEGQELENIITSAGGGEQ